MSAFADGFIPAADGAAVPACIQTSGGAKPSQQSGVILREAPHDAFPSHRAVAPTEESLSATVRPVERALLARGLPSDTPGRFDVKILRSRARR